MVRVCVGGFVRLATVSRKRKRTRVQERVYTWIFLATRDPPFDLFLAVECNRGPRSRVLQAPPYASRGKRGGRAKRRGRKGTRRVFHVFRLINIRENPLNWVIKRLRRHSNGERATLSRPHFFFSSALRRTSFTAPALCTAFFSTGNLVAFIFHPYRRVISNVDEFLFGLFAPSRLAL